MSFEKLNIEVVEPKENSPLIEGRIVSLTFVCIFFLTFLFFFWEFGVLIVSLAEVAVRKSCNSPQLLKYFTLVVDLNY